MSSETILTLNASRLRLQLSPPVGGAISTFEWIDGDSSRPILRKCHGLLENVLDACCFPLVPYVNRIRDGAFIFRSREVRLTPNMRGDRSPLHGQGWLNPWTVDRTTDREALLSYRHNPGEWPWAYEARQRFKLDEAGLDLTLECRNVSDEPMPCGLGEHPYFPCGAETRLDAKVEVAWTIDEHVLPVEKVAAEGRYDLSSRRVCGQDLDNGFGRWGGVARISDRGWPYDVRLTSPDAHFFQLYSPPQGSMFVAEPVTHANAALNHPESEWPELGMRVLEHGETMEMSMRLDVIPK